MTLTEVLVSVAIAAAIAAVTVPVMYNQTDDAVTKREAATLSNIAQAIMTYHDHVGNWPSTLTQLTTAPAPGANNICNLSLNKRDTANWLGPYMTVPPGASGLVIDDDTVDLTFTRVTTGTPTVLQILLRGTTSTQATRLQSMLDTDASSSTGLIRWTQTNRVTYNLPITGC